MAIDLICKDLARYTNIRPTAPQGSNLTRLRLITLRQSSGFKVLDSSGLID